MRSLALSLALGLALQAPVALAADGVMARALEVLLATTVPASAGTAGSDWMPVPTDLQITLIFTILTYDRQLVERVGSDLTFGVLSDAAKADSIEAKDAATAFLGRISDKLVKNIPIRFVAIDYTSPAALEADIKSNGIDVLYLTPGLGDRIDAVSRVCQNHGVTTTTGVPGYVDKGVAIGIGLRQDKPKILINLTAAKQQGSQFDASLLRIAEVLR